MASAATSRQCSKCNDAVGSFNCVGCKEIFCTDHSIAHRKELNARFEQLITDQEVILEQMKKNSLKQHLHDQIDDWQNQMIERVYERAKEIRGQINRLLDTDNQRKEEDIQSLADEMRTRQKKEDFFEDDIERIAQKIEEAKQFAHQPMEKPNMELKIEQMEDIDWENLIYIENQSNSTSSSITSKSNSGSNTATSEKTTDSNSTRSYPFIFSMRMNSPPSFVRQQIDPFDQRYAIPYFTPAAVPTQTTSTMSNSSKLPTSEKRERKPLTIVNPATHELVTLSTASVPADRNQTSSPVALNEEKRAEFRRQFHELLSADSRHRISQ